MRKGKKIYNLTIVFDDTTEEVEHLLETVHHENEPWDEYEEALSTLEEQYPDAPPDWFREVINDYYHALLDDSDIYGVA